MKASSSEYIISEHRNVAAKTYDGKSITEWYDVTIKIERMTYDEKERLREFVEGLCSDE